MDFDEQHKYIIKYILIVFLAMLGGAVKYAEEIIRDKDVFFSIIMLCVRMFTSGFAGLMFALICQAYGMNELMVYACAGLAGHMGGEGIKLVETFIKNKLLK